MKSTIAENRIRIEVYAGNCKFSLINKNFLEVTAIGSATLEDALAIKEATSKLLAEAEKSVVVLADVNKAGKSSPEARIIWKELSEDKRYYKIALVGLSMVSRMAASFAVALSNNKNIKFFSSAEEALMWLNK